MEHSVLFLIYRCGSMSISLSGRRALVLRVACDVVGDGNLCFRWQEVSHDFQLTSTIFILWLIVHGNLSL